MSAELIKSKFVWHPSSIRRCHRLFLNLLHGFHGCFHKFSCCLRWVIHPYVFWNFWSVYDFSFRFRLTWDPRGGGGISKRYSSCKTPPDVFKPFLYCLPKGPHKTAFGIYELFKNDEILTIFFFVFANMGLNWSNNCKTLLLRIATKCFHICHEFFSHWSS